MMAGKKFVVTATIVPVTNTCSTRKRRYKDNPEMNMV